MLEIKAEDCFCSLCKYKGIERSARAFYGDPDPDLRSIPLCEDCGLIFQAVIDGVVEKDSLEEKEREFFFGK